MKKLIEVAVVLMVVVVLTGCASVRQATVRGEKANMELVGKYGEFPKLWETVEVFLAVAKEQSSGPMEYILVWRRLNETGKVHVGRTESQIFKVGRTEPGMYLITVGEGNGYWVQESELKY